MESNRNKIKRYRLMRSRLRQYLLSDIEKTEKEIDDLIFEIAKINYTLKKLLSLPIEKLNVDSGTYEIRKPSKLNNNELS